MSDDFPDETSALQSLEADFIRGISEKDAGDFDRAEKTFRSILKTEPRLAEPRMELARILLETERVSDAEAHAREALTHLESGGQWTDDLPENVVLAIANALVAEALRRRADQDEILFGDPEVFKQMVADSKHHFAKACELDPSDETSSYYAFFMGPPDEGS